MNNVRLQAGQIKQNVRPGAVQDKRGTIMLKRKDLHKIYFP